jgi:DNA-binding NtrC family response regulator
VLLDEVAELSLAAQVALLRVLETRRFTRVGGGEEVSVDVHILAATHRDLEQMCAAGSFRWDLYYRLNTLTLDVPPLRLRQEEIRPMVRRFIDQANRLNHRDVLGITPEALQILEAYQWPGNVRELRNAIERAVVISLGDYITVDDLPSRLRPDPSVSEEEDIGEPQATDSVQWATPVDNEPCSLRDAVSGLERELLASAMCATGGNQSRAAQLLDMSHRTFVAKLLRYELADDYRAAQPLLPRFDEQGRRLAFKACIERLEREMVVDALDRAAGDRATAAGLLQIQKRTLDRKIGRYGISDPKSR